MTTGIEWTDETWNPITGCTPISEGCKNCYARRMAQRLKGRYGYPKANPFKPGVVHPDRWGDPEKWKKPRRIFVCSMSDLFHEKVPIDIQIRVFGRIAANPQHTFMMLTKRPENVTKFCRSIGLMPTIGGTPSGETWPDNLWLGVTAENQRTADERIPELLKIPTAVRFVSCEPLLGPVNLGASRGLPIYREADRVKEWVMPPRLRADGSKSPGISVSRPGKGWRRHDGNMQPGLDWIICGGETGPGARPMHPDWARSLRNQCQEAGVPFFFKHWGEWGFAGAKATHALSSRGELRQLGPADDAQGWWPCARVGKRVAGRLLDGREWNEVPEGGRHA